MSNWCRYINHDTVGHTIVRKPHHPHFNSTHANSQMCRLMCRLRFGYHLNHELRLLCGWIICVVFVEWALMLQIDGTMALFMLCVLYGYVCEHQMRANGEKQTCIISRLGVLSIAAGRVESGDRTKVQSVGFVFEWVRTYTLERVTPSNCALQPCLYVPKSGYSKLCAYVLPCRFCLCWPIQILRYDTYLNPFTGRGTRKVSGFVNTRKKRRRRHTLHVWCDAQYQHTSRTREWSEQCLFQWWTV